MNIYEKLINVQTQLKATKDQHNAFGKFNYRSVETILQQLKPLLKANNLALVLSDDITNINDLPVIKATATLYDACPLTRKDDSIKDELLVIGETSITNTAYAGVDVNKKGMDIAQCFGSSSTYARKYALCGLFAIDDNQDPDSMDNSGNDALPNNIPVGTLKVTSEPITEKQMKYLNPFFKGTDNAQQFDILKTMFNKGSLLNLTKQEASELINAMKLQKIEAINTLHNNTMPPLSEITQEHFKKNFDEISYYNEYQKVIDVLSDYIKQDFR